jgi:hypothetical protein
MKKAKLFSDKEKEFLNSKGDVALEQQGIYAKRIRERLEDLYSEEFVKSLSYLSPEKKYQLIELVFRQFSPKTAKQILKLLNQNIEQDSSLNIATSHMKKVQRGTAQFKDLLNFKELQELYRRINKGEKANQVIKDIRNSKEYTYSRKAIFDEEYLKKNKLAQECFNYLIKKEKLQSNEILKPTFKSPRRALTTFKRLAEKGIISCQVTEKKNLFKTCQKQLFEFEKQGIGRTDTMTIGYKIIPFDNQCKSCKKKCIFKLNEYSKYLQSHKNQRE